jgi:hypothetical protein
VPLLPVLRPARRRQEASAARNRGAVSSISSR